MSFTTDLLETAPSRSSASKLTAVNGLLHLGAGALLIVWPDAVQTLLFDKPFAGHEEALFRAIGLTIAVIGWVYIFGGRSGSRQFTASTVLAGGIFVPIVFVPLAMAGIFPHTFLAFAIIDATLAVGTLVTLGRET